MATANSRHTVFVYWNRRGAFSQIALEIAKLAANGAIENISLCASTQNELADEFVKWPAQIQLFPTFSTRLGALTGLPRFLLQVRRLVTKWKRDNVGAVVVLMPHVWTPILGYFLRRVRLKYAVIFHDAEPHLGDATAVLNPWLYGDAGHADLVLTLSRSVAEKLAAGRNIAAERIVSLFHPVVDYSTADATRPHAPLRVLFFGRIMTYKGLALLVAAAEQLRAEGITISLGVAGQGELGELAARLTTLGAEVLNEWLTPAQLAEVISRYDIAVLPYIEASQSGVVMTSFGAGMPVVVTPVGGLTEQVEDGVTGLVCNAATADAIADRISQLVRDPALCERLITNIKQRQGGLSVEAFIQKILATLRAQA